jgi:hypothetical protein
MYMYNVDGCQNAQTRATAMYVYVSTFLSLFHYLPPSFTLPSLHVLAWRVRTVALPCNSTLYSGMLCTFDQNVCVTTLLPTPLIQWISTREIYLCNSEGQIGYLTAEFQLCKMVCCLAPSIHYTVLPLVDLCVTFIYWMSRATFSA